MNNPSPDRNLSPLCDEEFRKPVNVLRPALPPRWMHWGLAVSLAAAVLVTLAVLLSDMDEYVVAPGVVRPAEFTLVFSGAGGILNSVFVTDGMPVKKGDVLARFDPWELKKQITKIEGDIAQAKAELDLSAASSRKIEAAPVPPEFLFSALEVERQQEVQDLQKDYLQKLQDLQKTGAASGTELLNIRLQLIATDSLLKRSQRANELFTGDYGTSAKAEGSARRRMIESRLATLQASLEQADEDMRRLEVVAPETGTILATARRFPGEKITPGTALFKVIQNNAIELRLYATEDRVNLITPGQAVRFRANNNPDRLARLAFGRVTSVAGDRDLETDPDAAGTQSTYRVTVAVENAPYELAFGATVQAEIVIARRPFWRLLLVKPKDEM